MPKGSSIPELIPSSAFIGVPKIRCLDVVGAAALPVSGCCKRLPRVLVLRPPLLVLVDWLSSSSTSSGAFALLSALQLPS